MTPETCSKEAVGGPDAPLRSPPPPWSHPERVPSPGSHGPTARCSIRPAAKMTPRKAMREGPRRERQGGGSGSERPPRRLPKQERGVAPREGSLLVEREGSLLVEREGSLLVETEESLLVEREGSLLVEREGSLLVEREGSLLVERGGVAPRRESGVAPRSPPPRGATPAEEVKGRPEPSVPAIHRHSESPLRRVACAIRASPSIRADPPGPAPMIRALRRPSVSFLRVTSRRRGRRRRAPPRTTPPGQAWRARPRQPLVLMNQ